MITATKAMEFCYGHRLMNYDGKCSMLHGHNARVEIDYSCDEIGPDGFAIDFKEIKLAVGKWIDDAFDHKTFLQEGDPIASSLIALNEPFTLVEWRPTAENIAKAIFAHASMMLDHAPGISGNVTAVRLWETPSSFVEFKP